MPKLTRHDILMANLKAGHNKSELATQLANHIIAAEDRERGPDDPPADLEELQTMKTHFGDCKSISTVLDNANALTTRANKLLAQIRESLGAMKKAQHPMVRVDVPHHLRSGPQGANTTTCSDIIGIETKRIDDLLGDRA